MSGEQFGYERTAGTIRQACEEGLSAEATTDRLLAEAAAFRGATPQSNDMTCVVVRVEDEETREDPFPMGYCVWRPVEGIMGCMAKKHSSVAATQLGGSTTIMGKPFSLLVMSLVLIAGTWAAAFADCFSVLVGKDASADGAVLFGHNEQNGGRRMTNYRYIPRMNHEPGTLVTLRNGGKLPEVEETYALIWLENVGIEFSDAYFNEWGVAVASDGCGTREDPYEDLVARGDIVDGGIGYMLRRLVAQRAKTSRQGVGIAVDLLSRFGYSASGRSLVVADPNEAWILSMVRGKHWIAQRCPDDGVVLLPNVHVIGPEADLVDTESVIASPDLVEYATERGWYDPSSGKPFSFREAYNRLPREGGFVDKYLVDPRQWYAQSMVRGKPTELPAAEQLPFSVKPAHRMTVADVARILRSHQEGTEFGAPQGHGSGNPHLMKTFGQSICTKSSQEGAVYQLRSWMPPEIGCVVWRTTAAPCANVLVPWYLGITETPRMYYIPWEIGDLLRVEHHFEPPAGTYDYSLGKAFDVFNTLENLVDLSYRDGIEAARAVWDPIEAEQFAVQPAVEKVALELYEKDKKLARRFLTMYTNGQATLAFEKAKQLVKELQENVWGY